METLGSPLKMESTSIQDIWWQKMKPYSNESLSKMHAYDLRVFNYECVGKHAFRTGVHLLCTCQKYLISRKGPRWAGIRKCWILEMRAVASSGGARSRCSMGLVAVSWRWPVRGRVVCRCLLPALGSCSPSLPPPSWPPWTLVHWRPDLAPTGQ